MARVWGERLRFEVLESEVAQGGCRACVCLQLFEIRVWGHQIASEGLGRTFLLLFSITLEPRVERYTGL